MTVTVLFHSYFKDLTGCHQTQIELAPGSTIAELRQKLQGLYPRLKEMARSTLIAVGVEYQPAEYRLNEGDEVSFFPPVQGG